MAEPVLSFAECLAKGEIIKKILIELMEIEGFASELASLTDEKLKISPEDELVVRTLKKYEQGLREVNSLLKKWEVDNLEQLSTRIGKLVEKNDNLTKEKSVLENDKTQLTTKNTELGDKISVLHLKIEVKDRELQEKDKTIQSLQLKNEKLTQNQKKLYGYLGDAWKMVSHLQKDLQTEKQDKAHIQKELDDTLAILNKPTSEMGTQTDLTAEQITKMEQSILKYQTDIQQEQNKVQQKETELTTLQKEIKGLQEKVKDKEPNETEQALSEVMKKSIAWEAYATHNINPNNLLNFLETGNSIFGGLSPSRVYDWNQLRGEYKDIHTKLIQLTKNMIESNDRQHEITKLEKDKGELQTKHDMEVRSKEELSEYLNLYRRMSCLDVSIDLADVEEGKEPVFKSLELIKKQHGVVVSYLRLNIYSSDNKHKKINIFLDKHLGSQIFAYGLHNFSIGGSIYFLSSGSTIAYTATLPAKTIINYQKTWNRREASDPIAPHGSFFEDVVSAGKSPMVVSNLTDYERKQMKLTHKDIWPNTNSSMDRINKELNTAVLITINKQNN